MKTIKLKHFLIFILPAAFGFLAIQLLGERTIDLERSISSIKQSKVLTCSLKANRTGNHVTTLEQKRLSKEELSSTVDNERGVYFDIQNAAGISLFWNKGEYITEYGFEDSSKSNLKKFNSLPFQLSIDFNIEIDVNGEFKPADQFILKCEPIRNPHL